MTDGPDFDPGPDMTAAELALGLLAGDERAAALRRLLADPAFAREVEGWRDRLAGLFDDYREVTAPDTVAARLATPDAPVARAPTRSAWPVLALATALVAAVALFFVARPGPTPLPIPQIVRPHAMMLAALAPSDKGAAAAPVGAAIDTVTGDIRIADASLAPAGKTAQLWMIAADGVPHSLGLLDHAGPTYLKMGKKERAALAAGVTLAVSIEPPGGSPKPTPTGPVVAAGKLAIV